MAMRNDVHYTLFRERDNKSTREPIASYATYREASQDGDVFHNKGGFHKRIERNSVRTGS